MRANRAGRRAIAEALETRWHLASNLLNDANLDGQSTDIAGRLVTVGTGAMFVARTRNYGEELWRTDGTAAGTTLLKDVNPGVGDGPNFSVLYDLGNGSAS